MGIQQLQSTQIAVTYTQVSFRKSDEREEFAERGIFGGGR
jgi:hypothetical protein